MGTHDMTGEDLRKLVRLFVATELLAARWARASCVPGEPTRRSALEQADALMRENEEMP